MSVHESVRIRSIALQKRETYFMVRTFLHVATSQIWTSPLFVPMEIVVPCKDKQHAWQRE